MIGIAEVLRKARQGHGAKAADIAAVVGISEQELLDLESYDDEIDNSLSISRIRKLLQVLRLEPVVVLGDPTDESLANVGSYQALANAVRLHLQEHGLTLSAFEALVGWELGRPLMHPEVFGEMNLDGLRSVATAIRVNPSSLLGAGGGDCSET